DRRRVRRRHGPHSSITWMDVPRRGAAGVCNMTQWMKAIFAIVVLAGTVSRGTVASGKQPPAPKPSAPEKSAGEALKNVQVLKDVPASEWNNVMYFIAGSLGVGCEHCHVLPYDADTKETKQTARRMMRMVRDINTANFDGKPVVTCNTCHRGSARPQ